MIPIRRLPEPAVLAANKARWCAAFLEVHARDPNKRPRSSQYAHPDIVATLEAMSHHKCFYCEQHTKQGRGEVDHHVEASHAPALSFEWTNLYLACCECNRKKQRHTSIPVEACLDPCDPDVRPENDLVFEDEYIRARDGSARGLATIQKYRLDRDDLDYKRVQQLRTFDKAFSAIQSAMIADGRKQMREDEKALLRRFRQPDYPFALMFRCYLEKLGV
jgi:hypothetical protein